MFYSSPMSQHDLSIYRPLVGPLPQVVVVNGDRPGVVLQVSEPSLMFRIERKYCLISTSYWQGYLTFSYYFTFDKIVCVW